jgi:hypothetical protein
MRLRFLLSELPTSQTRYCAELRRLLRRDAHGVMEEQIFQNLYLTVEMRLSKLPQSLGLSEPADVKCQLFDCISKRVSHVYYSWWIHLR